jgi:hypothetical protein
MEHINLVNSQYFYREYFVPSILESVFWSQSLGILVHGCETWSHNLEEEHRLRVLVAIFGRNKNENGRVYRVT